MSIFFSCYELQRALFKAKVDKKLNTATGIYSIGIFRFPYASWVYSFMDFYIFW